MKPVTVTIIMMASILRIPLMLVFHQSKCISAIKRTLPRIYPRVHSCICAFLIIAIHAYSSRVACGGEDVIHNTIKLRITVVAV